MKSFKYSSKAFVCFDALVLSVLITSCGTEERANTVVTPTSIERVVETAQPSPFALIPDDIIEEENHRVTWLAEPANLSDAGPGIPRGIISSPSGGSYDTSYWASEPNSGGDTGTIVTPATSAVFDGDLLHSEQLGDTECVTVSDVDKQFGEVTASDWKTWFSQYTYSQLPQYLSTGRDDGRAYIRQQLIPTYKGSHHVQAGHNLTAERTYRLTQSLYFEPGFDWGGKNEGGKVGFGVGGGSAPSGGQLQTDGFTLRLMWRGNKDGTAKLVAYSYAADRSQHLPYGDDYPLEGFQIPIGTWFDVTIEVKTNSTTSARDGSLRAWVDGQLYLQRENIGWQTSGSQPSVQKLAFTTFYGGNDSSWSPSHTTYIRFANTCWAPVLSYNSDDLQDDESINNQSPPLILKEDAVKTARGRIIEVLSDIELLLPTLSLEANWQIVEALDSINTALANDQWQDNEQLVFESSSIANLLPAVATLASITNNIHVAEHVNIEVKSASESLISTISTLINNALEAVESSLLDYRCSLNYQDQDCSNALSWLSQSREWLDQSAQTELSVYTKISGLEQAWNGVSMAMKTYH